MSTLADILRGIEAGVFSAPDLSVTVVPAPGPRESCVIGLTAHIVVAADVDPAWVADRLPPGDLSAPLNPPFLMALCDKTGRRLARAARALIPAGTHLWAQVTPGNAASFRAFLAAGFQPVGSEALLVTGPGSPID